MPDPAIQVDHVWKKFRRGEINDSMRDTLRTMARLAFGGSARDQVLGDREFWALQDVSFQVAPGESLGIIGPNGAGKSTMLKLLSRIIKPNRGSFHVNGRLSSLIEIGAGFHPDLTGRENMYLNATIHGMTRREIRKREQQIIQFADITDFIDTPVKRYSSGMKARLGFSVAAHLEPDILLVDEVLSVGDIRFRQKCLGHMEQLVKSNVTLIFISHLLDQVRRLCPNTIVFNHGRIMYEGPTEEAARIYIDALNEPQDQAEQDPDAEAEVRNIQFCDRDGREVRYWKVGQAAVIEMDVVLRRPVAKPSLIIRFFDVRGMYLGGDGSLRSDGINIPSDPGVYRIRYSLDPFPILDGDYAVRIHLNDEAIRPAAAIWEMSQPRLISVRGGKIGSQVVDCRGQWEMAPTRQAHPLDESRPAESA